MTILELIKKDHDQVKELLEQMLQTSPRAAKGRQEFANKLMGMMTPHNHGEEQVFYSKLLQVDSAHEDVLEALEEHHVAEMLLDEIVKTGPEDERWKAKVTVFQELIEHHVEEEEGGIFRLARGAFDRKQLTSMGEAFVEAKQAGKLRRAA